MLNKNSINGLLTFFAIYVHFHHAKQHAHTIFLQIIIHIIIVFYIFVCVAYFNILFNIFTQTHTRILQSNISTMLENDIETVLIGKIKISHDYILIFIIPYYLSLSNSKKLRYDKIIFT